MTKAQAACHQTAGEGRVAHDVKARLDFRCHCPTSSDQLDRCLIGALTDHARWAETGAERQLDYVTAPHAGIRTGCPSDEVLRGLVRRLAARYGALEPLGASRAF